MRKLMLVTIILLVKLLIPFSRVWATDTKVQMSVSLDRTKIIPKSSEPVYVAVDIELPKSAAKKEQKPIALVFVIDVSGSMQGDKLAQVKKASNRVIDMLGPQDRLSIVTFSDSSYDVYSPTGPIDFVRAHAAINGLHTIGGTNMVDGVRLGMKKMKALQLSGAVKSMLLFGDGDANVGTGDMKKIAAWARDDDAAVSTFGVGTDYNEAIMTKIAEVSGGNYHSIHDVTTTEDVLQKELGELRNLSTAQAQLIFKSPLGLRYNSAFGYASKMEAGPKVVSLRDLDEGMKCRVLLQFSSVDGSVGIDEELTVLLNYFDRKANDGRQVVARAAFEWVDQKEKAISSVVPEIFIAGRKAMVSAAFEKAADSILGPSYGERNVVQIKEPAQKYLDKILKTLRVVRQEYLPEKATELDEAIKVLKKATRDFVTKPNEAAKWARQKAKDLLSGK